MVGGASGVRKAEKPRSRVIGVDVTRPKAAKRGGVE